MLLWRSALSQVDPQLRVSMFNCYAIAGFLFGMVTANSTTTCFLFNG